MEEVPHLTSGNSNDHTHKPRSSSPQRELSDSRGDMPHHYLSHAPTSTTLSRPSRRLKKQSILSGVNVRLSSAAAKDHVIEHEYGQARQTEEEEEAIGAKSSESHEQEEFEDVDDVEEVDDTPHKISINNLGFEILDTIFSYFSNAGLSSPSSFMTDGYSHYENQQNLLTFVQVNRAFYRVAR